MKFSCADFTFPLLPHERVLDLLVLLEFEAVDLGLFEGRSHHHPGVLAGDPRKRGLALKEELDRRGLTPADVFVQLGPEPTMAAANDPEPMVRRENRRIFAAMVEFAQAVGASHVTGLPGVWHPGGDPARDWARAVEETAWRLQICRQGGLTYAIEPHVGSILPHPKSTLRFLSEVAGLTLTLDYGHFIYQGHANVEVHGLVPHASHFHARGGAPGQLQTTVKENTIDFPAILKEMKASAYDGGICLEYVWIDWEGCNRTDNLSETILLRKLLQGGCAER